MTMIHEHDFGTPASNKAQQVSLEIDGKSITVPADTSIMRAASMVGIDIPKLCSTRSHRWWICQEARELRGGS